MGMNPEIRKIFSEYGKRGPKALMRKYTAEQISEMRQKAARTRWDKHKKLSPKK